jgi:hypothetical protein
VVDVLQDHRLPELGDPAGEALAERDPDALPYLFLQPAGRRRHEEPARRVQQQHGRRVDEQELAHAVEQLHEHLLDPEMAECGVGDRLDTTEPLGRGGGERLPPVRIRHLYSHSRQAADVKPRTGLFNPAGQE